MIKKQIRSWVVNAYLLSLIEMERSVKDNSKAGIEKYRVVSSEFAIITSILEYKMAWDMLNHWRQTSEVYLLESDVTDLDPGYLREHITREFGKALYVKLYNHQEHIMAKHAIRALSLLSGIPTDTIMEDISFAYETNIL